MHLAGFAPDTGAHRWAAGGSAYTTQAESNTRAFEPNPRAYRNCPGAVGQLVLEPARPSLTCAEPPKYTRWHGPSRIT